MAEVKVIYGSSNGNTRDAAQRIAAELGGTAIDIAGAGAADLNADLVVLGTSTWGIGELQDDWCGGVSLLDQADWKGRKVALFGLGDQISFGDSFIDAVRVLYDKVSDQGAEVLGRWSAAGYRHSGSAAEVDGEFVGLALDDDNEAELTAQRIGDWCRQLKSEAGL